MRLCALAFFLFFLASLRLCVFALRDFLHDPQQPIPRQHRQPQHQQHAVAVGRAVGLDDREEVQQRKGQRHGRLQPVQVKVGASVDLEQRPQRKEAKEHARPNPDAQPAAEGERTHQRQQQACPAQEDGVDIAEAPQGRVGGALLHQVQFGHHVAAKERVKDRGREPAQQVRAQLERVAPALEAIVGVHKGEQDRDQHRRPDKEGHTADEGEGEGGFTEGGRMTRGGSRRGRLRSERAAGVEELDDQDDDRKNAQKQRADHLGQPREGKEEPRQHRRPPPRPHGQPAIQRPQQHQGIKGNPLRRHHIVVAQRRIDRPIGGEGVERAGQEGGEDVAALPVSG